MTDEKVLREAAQALIDEMAGCCDEMHAEKVAAVRQALATPAESQGKSSSVSNWGMSENLTVLPPSPPEGEPLPYAYACPAKCGCIWRDNHDGTMSLFGKNSQSCEVCEPLPLDKLIPLWGRAQAGAPTEKK